MCNEDVQIEASQTREPQTNYKDSLQSPCMSEEAEVTWLEWRNLNDLQRYRLRRLLGY